MHASIPMLDRDPIREGISGGRFHIAGGEFLDRRLSA